MEDTTRPEHPVHDETSQRVARAEANLEIDGLILSDSDRRWLREQAETLSRVAAKPLARHERKP